MLLLTVVYNSSMESIIDEIKDVKNCFEHKKTILGIAESIIGDTHFVKFFCGEDNLSYNNIRAFNFNIANMLYKIVIMEFYKKQMNNFLTETYFFLRYDEIKEIKPRIKVALLCDGEISGPNMVYCINKKNGIMDKISKCIEENKEINISGFLTFRTKELKMDLECIVDKVVEEYMAEKEYGEFIKLLRYFVEIQDSKVDEVNILIQRNGDCYLKDEGGNDLAEEMLMELPNIKFGSTENTEELIISTMITVAPKKVIIHCSENCKNKEFLQTISNVFVDKVSYCNDCAECAKIKNAINTW